MVLGFDPFRDVDRLVDAAFAAGGARRVRGIPMDLYRSGDHYVLHADLAGIDPGSVDITVDGSVLTITAQRSTGTGTGDVRWLARERATGTFTRQIGIGEDVDADRIAATYTDGVLTVTIPVAESAKPRKIAISRAGEPTAGQLTDATALTTAAAS